MAQQLYKSVLNNLFLSTSPMFTIEVRIFIEELLSFPLPLSLSIPPMFLMTPPASHPRQHAPMTTACDKFWCPTSATTITTQLPPHLVAKLQRILLLVIISNDHLWRPTSCDYHLWRPTLMVTFSDQLHQSSPGTNSNDQLNRWYTKKTKTKKN